MSLMHPGLPCNRCILILLHLRHALPSHLPILEDQPRAQHEGEDGDEQAESGGDPHALAEVGLLGVGEDVRACVATCVLVSTGMY